MGVLQRTLTSPTSSGVCFDKRKGEIAVRGRGWQGYLTYSHFGSRINVNAGLFMISFLSPIKWKKTCLVAFSTSPGSTTELLSELVPKSDPQKSENILKWMKHLILLFRPPISSIDLPLLDWYPLWKSDWKVGIVVSQFKNWFF